MLLKDGVICMVFVQSVRFLKTYGILKTRQVHGSKHKKS